MIIQGFECTIFTFDSRFFCEFVCDLKIFDNASFLGNEINFFSIFETANTDTVSGTYQLQIDEVFQYLPNISSGIPSDETISKTNIGDIVLIVDFKIFFCRWIFRFSKMNEICFLPIFQIGKDSFWRKFNPLRLEIITDTFCTKYTPNITKKISIEILKKCDISEAKMSDDIFEEDG